MRWTPGGESQDVEDRRDESGGGGGGFNLEAYIGIGGAILHDSQFSSRLTSCFAQRRPPPLGPGTVTARFA